MKITKDIREIKQHVRAIAIAQAAQIAIISTAQAEICKRGDNLTPGDLYAFAVLTVAKNRIIHGN